MLEEGILIHETNTFTAVVQAFFPEDGLPLMITNLHKKQEYFTQQSPASSILLAHPSRLYSLVTIYVIASLLYT